MRFITILTSLNILSMKPNKAAEPGGCAAARIGSYFF